MTLEEITAVRVTVINPETPFGGVQVFGGPSPAGTSEAEPDLPSVATDFLTLTDTPDSYVGQGGKFVRVKADESGLEFVDAGDIVVIPPPETGFNRITTTGDSRVTTTGDSRIPATVTTVVTLRTTSFGDTRTTTTGDFRIT